MNFIEGGVDKNGKIVDLNSWIAARNMRNQKGYYNTIMRKDYKLVEKWRKEGMIPIPVMEHDRGAADPLNVLAIMEFLDD